MSYPDLYPSGGVPAGTLPLRELILSALALTAITCRSDPALRNEYETAYAQVSAGTAEWADLAVAMQAGVN